MAEAKIILIDAEDETSKYSERKKRKARTCLHEKSIPAIVSMKKKENRRRETLGS